MRIWCSPLLGVKAYGICILAETPGRVGMGLCDRLGYELYRSSFGIILVFDLAQSIEEGQHRTLDRFTQWYILWYSVAMFLDCSSGDWSFQGYLMFSTILLLHWRHWLHSSYMWVHPLWVCCHPRSLWRRWRSWFKPFMRINVIWCMDKVQPFESLLFWRTAQANIVMHNATQIRKV